MCVCVIMCQIMCTLVQYPWSPGFSYPLELELQEVVILLMWVLETALWSSSRALLALNSSYASLNPLGIFTNAQVLKIVFIIDILIGI